MGNDPTDLELDEEAERLAAELRAAGHEQAAKKETSAAAAEEKRRALTQERERSRRRSTELRDRTGRLLEKVGRQAGDVIRFDPLTTEQPDTSLFRLIWLPEPKREVRFFFDVGQGGARIEKRSPTAGEQVVILDVESDRAESEIRRAVVWLGESD